MKAHISRIKDALTKAEMIILGADCTVNYSGRAETFLPRGERIIMIKPDKTLLVHQPEGNTPVNYMKGESVHELVEEGGKLYLKSQNQQMQEYIDIAIENLHFVQTTKLTDGQKLQLTGDERDMADMIAADPSIIEKGLATVSREEQTTYGFVDVLCKDKDGSLVAIECKRYTAGLDAVTQLRRYVEKLKASKGIVKVRGIIAAPSITDNAKKMLADWGFTFVAVEPPKYKERLKKTQKRLGEF